LALALGFLVVALPSLAAAGDFGCAPAPLDDCRHTTQPRKSRLLLRSGDRPDKQTLVWKWFRGEATAASYYGSPTTTDAYALCMYAQNGALIFDAVVPGGGACGGHLCWHPIGERGFRYRDGQGRNDGITKIRLYKGEEGQAKVIVKGRGSNLSMADLPLGLPTLVQLQTSAGNHCFEASFGNGGVTRNNDTRFAARSDLP
jgi:hypothetical protein